MGKVKIVGGAIPEAPPVPPLPSQVNEVVQIGENEITLTIISRYVLCKQGYLFSRASTSSSEISVPKMGSQEEILGTEETDHYKFTGGKSRNSGSK